jgi:hypothetical protein
MPRLSTCVPAFRERSSPITASNITTWEGQKSKRGQIARLPWLMLTGRPLVSFWRPEPQYAG